MKDLEEQPPALEYFQFSPGEKWQTVIFRGVVLGLGASVHYAIHALEQMEDMARTVEKEIAVMNRR